jgi:hypothetical protein
MGRVIFIDFDGTICPYGKVVNPPYDNCVKTIQKLYERGDKIHIWSCRGNKDVVRDMTDAVAEMVTYLKKHDIPFHEIEYGKPLFDVVIDDRALNANDNWDRLAGALGAK